MRTHARTVHTHTQAPSCAHSTIKYPTLYTQPTGTEYRVESPSLLVYQLTVVILPHQVNHELQGKQIAGTEYITVQKIIFP